MSEMLMKMNTKRASNKWNYSLSFTKAPRLSELTIFLSVIDKFINFHLPFGFVFESLTRRHAEWKSVMKNWFINWSQPSLVPARLACDFVFCRSRVSWSAQKVINCFAISRASSSRLNFLFLLACATNTLCMQFSPAIVMYDKRLANYAAT